MARPNDGIPRASVDDDVSGAITMDLRHLWRSHEEARKDMARHFDDDVSIQKVIWERLHKLDNLRWWVTGAAAVVVFCGSMLYALGSRYLQLEVSAVVLKQVQNQTAATNGSLEAKIDSTNKFIQEQAAENKRDAEDKFKRIESALRKR